MPVDKLSLPAITRRPRHTPDWPDVPPLLARILAGRGVDDPAQLNLALKRLPHPSSFTGLRGAVELLLQGRSDHWRICIVGDYDADGATATTLMVRGLELLGFPRPDFLVPDRFEYGYGLSPAIVELAQQQYQPDLIITVDNGIASVDGVAAARARGIKVLITDHHLPGDTLPEADALVNPRLPGCEDFPAANLAGVGVAFYFMLALRKYLREQQWFEQQNIKEPNIAQLLDLVALGTVADVVSLDANNRILVEQGLKRIRAGATRPGIQALIEIAGKNQQKLVASDFGFALGPRINAAGRLDDMAFGINCLLAKDLSTARVMAADLDDLNKARREIEQSMQIEAEQVLTSLQFSEENLPHGISLFHADWHQGVIGIVAGRLKEKYHRPSIVFARGSDENIDDTHNDNNEIKGSARSIPGLHIRDLLEYIDSQHPGIIAKFGGHACLLYTSDAADE